MALLAKSGKVFPDDMSGASLVVRNIVSISDNAVGPVTRSPMSAIIAIGQIEEVRASETHKEGIRMLVQKRKAVLSWSADHWVLDGATIAR